MDISPCPHPSTQLMNTACTAHLDEDRGVHESLVDSGEEGGKGHHSGIMTPGCHQHLLIPYQALRQPAETFPCEGVVKGEHRGRHQVSDVSFGNLTLTHLATI